MTDFQKQVIDLVNQGKTHSEICKILNRRKSSVSSVIKRFSLSPKKCFVNTVKADYFDNINSEAKAYFLGFFIADGTVEKSGRFGFNIQEEDGYLLDILSNEICCPNKIRILSANSVGCKYRKPRKQLRWTSYKMLEAINRYGLCPNKTSIDFNFPIEKVPLQFRGALIRGFIDGDGSFEQHKGAFNPTICGPNHKWLMLVGDEVSKNTGLTYKIHQIKGKTCTYWVLRWKADNKNKFEKIQKLYNFLYKDATIFLGRKKDKIVAYLEYRAKQLFKSNCQCNA